VSDQAYVCIWFKSVCQTDRGRLRCRRNEKAGAVSEGKDQLDPQDHHLSGFDEGGDGLSFLEAHLADGVSSNNGGDVLTAD